MDIESGKKISRLIWNITFVVFSLAVFLTGATYQSWMTNIAVDTVSCEGIEKWYTNDSFQRDSWNMIDEIGYETNPKVLDPKTLSNGTQGDCKTISHSIMCLSRLYNNSCVYYVTNTYDPTIEGDSIMDKYTGHLGIKCKNRWGEWQEFY